MDMLPIPVSAAKEIADRFGYDQVIVIARRVGEAPAPHGEHVTTYGRNPDHCRVAANTGRFLKHKVMGWPQETDSDVLAERDKFREHSARLNRASWRMLELLGDVPLDAPMDASFECDSDELIERIAQKLAMKRECA